MKLNNEVLGNCTMHKTGASTAVQNSETRTLKSERGLLFQFIHNVHVLATGI